ncbi:CidA/LrgA family protein [Amphritea sp. 2_MG-2023]|uniref:CidA/LrgA family protein n=1 Tax=Amphritea TaxID=515417 RepID=UPI001C0662C6|nr:MULTISPECIES: CidA/LrgA family protein [Amphritea]MBU2965213.1 CidA/LrgA family protein [Amphritea atlantica]MDO6419718.1 CidA/LrgA family protein [Amphritea sp. 2_MG-2023]
MLVGFLMLLLFQLAGELIVVVLGMPVPGPVVGMVLLLMCLIAKGDVPESLRIPSEALLKHLALLFVPAGVGLMTHFSLLKADWLAILLALIVSTGLTIVVTALILNPSAKKLHQLERES